MYLIPKGKECGWNIQVIVGMPGMEDHAVVSEVGSGDWHVMSLLQDVPQVVNINGYYTGSTYDWMDGTDPTVIDVYARSW